MVETRYFPLTGGLDVVTPAVETPAGRAIAGLNYEPHPKGYQRKGGFERFDGQPKPSEATYWIQRFDQGSAAVLAGDIVKGLTFAAEATALVDGVLESGTYGGGDAAGYLVLTGVEFFYVDNELLQVGGMTRCRADGAMVERGAETDGEDTTWQHAAIELARALIAAPPGSGPTRGVWTYKGNTYAIRDNAGATAGVMYKATATGWQAQNLGAAIPFTAGTVSMNEANVTGGTSGATATIRRVVVESGDWSTNDAAGRLIVTNVVGTFQNGELLTGGGGSATAAGPQVNNVLPPGGRYQFDNHNFYGAAARERMYGVNGVGQGFEWDGLAFVFINTGMDDDRPHRLAIHQEHLFFAFPGGSLQHSGTGTPYNWTVLFGAGEIGIGEEITDLLPSVSGVLVVFGLNSIALLLGNDSSNWQRVPLSGDSGAVPWTAQTIGVPTYLDNGGVRSLEATEKFGDFARGTLTRLVEPIIRAKRKLGITAVASLRVRDKDQYRLYWSDGTGITVYFGRDPVEILPFDIGFAPAYAASGKDEDGNEILFLCHPDGMVYQADAGTSFDGEAVPAFLRLPFNHVGMPQRNKRWTKTVLEIDGGPGTILGLTAEFDYADPDQPPSGEQAFEVKGGGGFWNEFLWDEFYWSSPVEGRAEAFIDGLGRNISITAVSNATYEEPHVLHGLHLHFTYRGVAR